MRASDIIDDHMDLDLTLRLKDQARRLGFSMAGVVEARPGRRLDAYRRWLAKEYHGSMAYMARPDRVARRENLSVILPGVRSIVCVGLDYATLEPPAQILREPGRGRISNYTWGADYHDVILPRLEALAEWLALESDLEVTSKAYVDTGAILERDHAESAGLGFTGKNTMLIGPRRGSWFFLGELLTTAMLVPDQLKQPMPGCGSCSRCLVACPTDAFPEPYVLDSRRCISYLTIEHKGWIPRELRRLMGNWVYGCDICQEVCPFNRFARPAEEEVFQPARWNDVAPSLLDLLALDDQTFKARFSGSPIKRIGRTRMVRNACIAAGNWGDEAAITPLTELLADAEPLVRGHAAWALAEIGGLGEVLQLALEGEFEEQVREELFGAIYQ